MNVKIYLILYFLSDKHPQLNEFLTQIKNTPDLANLFESIQKDASSGMDTFTNAMDISWRDGRREAGMKLNKYEYESFQDREHEI